MKEGGMVEVDVDLAESPLSWLRSRRGADGSTLIEDVAFLAGERLRSDYTIAGLIARTTMNWDALGGPSERRRGSAGAAAAVGEAAEDARRRVSSALEAVGPDLASVLVDVCCHLKGLGEVEKSRGYPSRSAKVVLRIALAALARHYGLDEVATGSPSTRIRRWGTSDHRPRA